MKVLDRARDRRKILEKRKMRQKKYRKGQTTTIKFMFCLKMYFKKPY